MAAKIFREGWMDAMLGNYNPLQWPAEYRADYCAGYNEYLRRNS